MGDNATRTRTAARPITAFGMELERQLLDQKLTLTELAARSGIDHGTLSKLRSGRQLTIGRDHLEALLRGFGDDPSVHAALIKAHLQDHCHGPNSDLIEIRIRKTVARPGNPTLFERALAHLEMIARRDREFSRWLITQARMFGMDQEQAESVRTTHSRKSVLS